MQQPVIKALVLALLFSSCNRTNHEKPINPSTTTPNTINSSIPTPIELAIPIKKNSQDTIITNQQNQSKTNYYKQSHKKRNEPEIGAIRYAEFPNDNAFNGQPMIQQEDLPKMILTKHRDTLINLAIARYKTYDYFFPKSISDNFEAGTSVERTHYPKKLIFRFQLFENQWAEKPYTIQDIIIRRDDKGELYAE